MLLGGVKTGIASSLLLAMTPIASASVHARKVCYILVSWT